MEEAKILTNTILKGTMTDALVYRDYCTDFDTCKTPGYYTVSAQKTVNHPPGAYTYGILEVKVAGSFISQIYHAHQDGSGNKSSAIYMRMWHTDSGWNTWVRLTAVAAV